MQQLAAVLIIAVVIAAFAISKNVGICALVAGLVYALISQWHTSPAPEETFTATLGEMPKETFVTAPCDSREKYADAPCVGADTWCDQKPTPFDYVMVPYPGAVDEDFHEDYPAGEYNDRQDCTVEGDPRNYGNLGSPPGGPSCFDREANDDEIDGDERMAYQMRGRNDPLRPTLGATKRVALLDEAVREELEETEDLPWWGRHEQ